MALKGIFRGKMEVIIVVSKKQRGVIQDLHREVWSLSGELWPGDSIVIRWTLKRTLETSVRHIMGRLKFLFDREAFCYKFNKNHDGSPLKIFLCKTSNWNR